jgi:hypothetical protein
MAVALRCKSDEGGGASVLLTNAWALRRGEEGVSASFGAERSRGTKESSRGHRRLLTKRKREMGGRGRHHAEEGGGAVWSSAMLREGERSPTPGSCAGAAETGAGQAVSGTVRKQGSGRCAWAARKCVGRPREGNELGRF